MLFPYKTSSISFARAAFRSLLASVHPLARSCSTAASKTGRRFAPFSSRRPHHITANAHPSFRTPHLILLHTQTSRLSSLPFKPVRLLRAPLCSTIQQPPAISLCSLSSPLRRKPCSTLRHKLLATCSGLYRLFCSPPLSRRTHRPADRARSPSSPSACSALPFAALSGNRQPFSAVRTLRHEPLPPSFSLRSSRPSPNQWPRQLPSAGHRPRPASPLMRVARPAPPRFSTSAPDPSSSVSRSLSAQLFAVLLTSAPPPTSRFRSAATNEAIHRTTPQ